MKKILHISLSLTIFALLSTTQYIRVMAATTPTPKTEAKPSVTPADKDDDSTAPTPAEGGSLIDKLKQIKILKDKIATKVAEIRENEKGAIAGVVKSVETNSITVAGTQGNRTIAFSEDTTFYTVSGTTKTASTVKKIKEGEMIAAMGYFTDTNKNSISAKYIYIPTPVRRVIGKIADIDKENYTITIKERQGNTLVDIESTTRTFAYDKEGTKTRAGFSRLKIGDIVHILGTTNAKDASRASADKIYILTIGTPEPQPTNPPAGGPTEPAAKASPTPAKKSTPVPTKKPTVTP